MCLLTPRCWLHTSSYAVTIALSCSSKSHSVGHSSEVIDSYLVVYATAAYAAVDTCGKVMKVGGDLERGFCNPMYKLRTTTKMKKKNPVRTDMSAAVWERSGKLNKYTQNSSCYTLGSEMMTKRTKMNSVTLADFAPAAVGGCGKMLAYIFDKARNS